MSNKDLNSWHFLNEEGTFQLINPHQSNYLYFPLVNEAGMMSAVTPTLKGDSKSGLNSFLTLPVSVEDLHDTRSGRNFWVVINDKSPWSATGNSAPQIADQFSTDPQDEVTLEAGFLWHKITRSNRPLGLEAEITNFVPANTDLVELMQVKLKNLSTQPLTLTPTAAIPIFGRSADNLRDHRHVTSLLHRIQCRTHGIVVRPTLSFDERGHTENQVSYAVLGVDEKGNPPNGLFPILEDFIGEGGNLDWPEAVVNSLPPEKYNVGQTLAGYEAMGGLRFKEITLEPGQSTTYILVLGILHDGQSPQQLIQTYGAGQKYEASLQKTHKAWKTKLDSLILKTGDSQFDGWMKWVTLQPTLRRLFGNSYLPYHDYGRGGRGWRDLWQDVLALLITEPGDVSDQLEGFFAGVRLDGSNATIIGSGPGEFKADRNDIPRVWMDHGAWPLLTTRLYIDLTGDLCFLLREQSYFKDHLTHRAQKIDQDWQTDHGTELKTRTGEIYHGTILEHLLVQNLVPFFNVGEHNIILLEGADWNDGLDMAPERGESVAFSALYAGNLRQLSELVLALKSQSIEQVEVAVELLLLLDRLDEPISYDSIADKRARLGLYFDTCRSTVAGRKTQLNLQELAEDLQLKADWLTRHIRTQEWVHSAAGHGWFNGYYDNDGRRLEGDHPLGVRMTLTGQVFTLMGGVATDEQAKEMIKAADHHLFDESIGGFRLNTDFGEVILNLGRAFGYAFGHKENGAMFSHMAVMYANALYQRGFVQEGHRVLEAIYRHSVKFPISRMYPGIPEYFNNRGRGMYPWLTGSASWYLLTMVTEVFGIKGRQGDLEISPKLVAGQFDGQGIAAIFTRFAGKSLKVAFSNANRLNYGEYQIDTIKIAGKPSPFERSDRSAILAREAIEKLPDEGPINIEVGLVWRD